MKLFHVSGVRHSAVVLAETEQEAVKLAASDDEKSDQVLYGHVDGWEAPEAQELKLPSGYRLTGPQ